MSFNTVDNCLIIINSFSSWWLIELTMKMLLQFIVGTLIISIIYGSLPPSDDNILHIGGIFPIGGEGGWQGGQVCQLLSRHSFNFMSIIPK